MSYILQNGSQKSTRTNVGETVLHKACQTGHSEVVHILLDYKVQVEVACRNGWTPLNMACYKRHKVETLHLHIGNDLMDKKNPFHFCPLSKC